MEEAHPTTTTPVRDARDAADALLSRYRDLQNDVRRARGLGREARPKVPYRTVYDDAEMQEHAQRLASLLVTIMPGTPGVDAASQLSDTDLAEFVRGDLLPLRDLLHWGAQVEAGDRSAWTSETWEAARAWLHHGSGSARYLRMYALKRFLGVEARKDPYDAALEDAGPGHVYPNSRDNAEYVRYLRVRGHFLLDDTRGSAEA